MLSLRRIRLFGSVSLLAVSFALPMHAVAQQDTKSKETEELERRIIREILQQLPQEIMKVLLQQNLLNRQIARGVDEYFQRQQQVQAAEAAKREKTASEVAQNVRPPSKGRDHFYGNPDALVTLIVYSDFECPFCKQFHAVPMEVIDSYNGKVNLVYRHMPLPMHNPGATKQAQAAECASQLGGDSAFWAYTNAIYSRTRSNGTGFPTSQLSGLAFEIGLDEKLFAECSESSRFASRVQEDIDDANSIGVSGTPTTVILDNSSRQVILRAGALPASVLKADIDRFLVDNSSGARAPSGSKVVSKP